MVTTVIVINVLIALAGFFAAWQIWQLRRTLAGVTKTLEAAERSTHSVLYGAPESIQKGQLGIYELRQAYQRSGPQLQRVRRALALLGLGRSLWLGNPRRSTPLVQRGVRSLLRRPKSR